MKEIQTRPVPLSDILQTFFQNRLNNTDHGIEIKLWKNWSHFATTEILKCAKPVNYQNGRLILWVAHSVALQELSFHLEDLKQAINSHFKKDLIKDIYFTVNKDLLNKKVKTLKFLQKISEETPLHQE